MAHKSGLTERQLREENVQEIQESVAGMSEGP